MQEEDHQAGENMVSEVGTKPGDLFDYAPDEADNLRQIKGVGTAAEKQLNFLGIYHLRQIANLDSANVDWVESHLKNFKGRILRDDWIGQASLLVNTNPPSSESSGVALH